MQPGPEYWTTLAQVMPVVAFALVFEVRGLMQGGRVPASWLRFAFFLMVGFSLVSLGLGEAHALAALRGEPQASYWSSLCETAIAAGMGLLVLTPTVFFLIAGNADLLARLMLWGPRHTIRLVRVRLQTRTVRRKFHRAERRLLGQYDRIQAMITRHTKGLNELAAAAEGLAAVRDRDEPRATAALNIISASSAEGSQLYDEAIGISREIEETLAEVRKGKSEFDIAVSDVKVKYRKATAADRAALAQKMFELAKQGALAASESANRASSKPSLSDRPNKSKNTRRRAVASARHRQGDAG